MSESKITSCHLPNLRKTKNTHNSADPLSLDHWRLFGTTQNRPSMSDPEAKTMSTLSRRPLTFTLGNWKRRAMVLADVLAAWLGYAVIAGACAARISWRLWFWLMKWAHETPPGLKKRASSKETVHTPAELF